MTSKILATLVGLMMAQSAMAGSANAFIKCVSGSGKTHLNAEFPVDEFSAAMVVTVEGKSLVYVNEDAKMRLDEQNGAGEKQMENQQVVEIKAEQTKSSITMTAVTDTGDKFDNVHLHLRSVGALKSTGPSHNRTINFAAILTGTDPRDAAKQLPEISLKCVYNYSL